MEFIRVSQIIGGLDCFLGHLKYTENLSPTEREENLKKYNEIIKDQKSISFYFTDDNGNVNKLVRVEVANGPIVFEFLENYFVN